MSDQNRNVLDSALELFRATTEETARAFGKNEAALFVDLSNPGARVKYADDIALVRLDSAANPARLDRLGLARDFEREDGLWIVDVRSLERLSTHGDALQVLWQSNAPADQPMLVDHADLKSA